MFFNFESDFVESLRCIPMTVRLKLDTCGIKLKLDQWNRLMVSDRQQLISQPCTAPEEVANYRAMVQQLVQEHTGQVASELPIDLAPPWLDATVVPDSVEEKARSLQLTITQADWAKLNPTQRFALIKLSRSNHENQNFLPALREFGLVEVQ
ncbi:nitrate reductase associated protein [Leptolyngbya sp. AN02str]|uniref:nitrate reductase associated protein n=1 Tax=Leptolyngbya sp. AN02str TaxID=3423363 RepID=UPI003D314912